MTDLVLDKLKRYIISFIIFVLTIQTTFMGGIFQLEKAKAISPGTDIYATASGGSDVIPDKSNVTGAPDGNYATVPSDVADRYVYGKTYTNALAGTITKVEIAAKYKVDTAFTDDQFNLKYKIGSTGNPYGATSYTEIPTNTSFATYYLDITGDQSWTFNDITNLYIYAINNVAGSADGNNLLIDALWVRVTYTLAEPTSSVTYPTNNYHYNSLSTVTGTATDNSGTGLDFVDVKVKRGSDGFYFTGSSWIDTATWLRASGTTLWSYSLNNNYLTNGESYTIYSRATDLNTPTPGVQSAYGTALFYYDTQLPTGTVLINGGADATDGKGDYHILTPPTYPYVELDFTYDDGIFSPCADEEGYKILGAGQYDQMWVSNNRDNWNPDGRNVSSGSWQTMTDEIDPWYLTDGDGLKTVYVKFRDKAGNVSGIYEDSIFVSQKNNGEKQTTVDNSTTNYDPFGDGSVTMVINTKTGQSTTLFSSTYSGNPTGTSSGITFLGKYYDFNFADTSTINFPIYIKIYYSEADLAAAGITENQLEGIFYYDHADAKWKLYSGDGISTTGVNKTDNYVWANAYHLTPMGPGGDITAPTKPANFKATAGNEEVTLNWDKKDDAIGYYIRYRKATSNDSNTYTTIFLSGGDTKTTKISGLVNGTEYEFGIAAKDSAGNVSEYAVVVSTPVASGTKTHTDSSLKGYWIGTAMAADSSGNTSDKQNNEIKKDDTSSDEVQSDEEENGINWTRFLVTLGIIVLAAGAGFGGYYGYQWWMGTDEEEKKEVNKEDKKPNKKKRDNRW